MQSSPDTRISPAFPLPPGSTVRAITLDDAASVVEVMAAVERAEPADENWGIEDVLEQLRSPGVDLARDSIGVFDRERLVGLGMLAAAPPTDAFRAFLSGAVHPEYGHRGIGTAVVEELARRAVIRRDEHDPALPGELKLWIPSSRAATAALAQARGFSPWRWFFRMRRDLAEPVAPADAGPEYPVRPYRSEDEEGVRIARNLSFADHWGSSPTDVQRWHAAFEGSPTFRPQHSRVIAAPDGSISAFVMAAEFASDTASRGYATGYVSLVGTVREARGRGLASVLVSSVLESLAADGYRYAELEVDADSPTGAGRIYQRLGFVTQDRNTVMGRRF